MGKGKQDRGFLFVMIFTDVEVIGKVDFVRVMGGTDVGLVIDPISLTNQLNRYLGLVASTAPSLRRPSKR